MLEWYRGEDARDVKKGELNELVEKWTCLNALEGKIWKSDQKVVVVDKSWKTWKSNQHNCVMNEGLVQNGVRNAKIDPKVVMDLSIFKNWWMGQFATQQPKIVGRIY